MSNNLEEMRVQILVYLGRGRTGKTTHMRVTYETAEIGKRRVVIADCDRTNATLSSFVRTALRPQSSDDATVTKFIEDLMTHAIETRESVMIDLGGGDGVFPVVAQRHKFFEVLPQYKVDIVPIYFAAGGRDDLEILHGMYEKGLRSPKTIIVFNEGLAGNGNDPFAAMASGKTVKRAVEEGARVLRMPALPIATMNEADGLFIGLHAAAAGGVPLGEDGLPHPAARPLGFWRRIELSNWLVELDKRQKEARITEWLP